MIFIFSACAKSPAPNFEPIIDVRPPTFGGLAERSYTISSQTFLMSGECDPKSALLQYSLNGTNWIQLSAGCVNSTFSQSVTVTQGYTVVYVRARGKGGRYSPSARAKVTFALPPSAPFLTFVQSSRSDSSDLSGPGTQNAVGLTFTGAPLSSATHRLDTYVPGIVYAP